jgi:hypothetical protein
LDKTASRRRRLHSFYERDLIMTKLYEVDIYRTSWVTLTIEANSEEEAEAKAWKEIEARGDMGDAHWECERVEEVEVQS